MATQLSEAELTKLIFVNRLLREQSPGKPNAGEVALKEIAKVIKSSTGHTELSEQALDAEPVRILVQFILALNGVSV